MSYVKTLHLCALYSKIDIELQNWNTWIWSWEIFNSNFFSGNRNIWHYYYTYFSLQKEIANMHSKFQTSLQKEKNESWLAVPLNSGWLVLHHDLPDATGVLEALLQTYHRYGYIMAAMTGIIRKSSGYFFNYKKWKARNH